MRRVPALLLGGVLVGACAAAPLAVSSAPANPAPGNVAPASVLVAVEFEPPLPTPSRLQVVHESGAACDLVTQCTGVVVALPPGPALLRLLREGAWEELPLHVVVDMSVVVWRRAR